MGVLGGLVFSYERGSPVEQQVWPGRREGGRGRERRRERERERERERAQAIFKVAGIS